MWPANFSVKIGDVTDGTSNTIFLVENDSSDVICSEPRDMREKNALAQLRPTDQAKPNARPLPRIPILLVDGSVRMISPQINRDVFVSLLTPKFGEFMVADGWPREDRPASKLPDAVDISRFPKKPLRFIADARQSMRFRLDEYGAELVADTSMLVGENGDGALHIDTLQPRRLVFDRPFLLALKEKKATVPYFLAWIGNADLMELAKP